MRCGVSISATEKRIDTGRVAIEPFQELPLMPILGKSTASTLPPASLTFAKKAVIPEPLFDSHPVVRHADDPLSAVFGGADMNAWTYLRAPVFNRIGNKILEDLTKQGFVSHGSRERLGGNGCVRFRNRLLQI